MSELKNNVMQAKDMQRVTAASRIMKILVQVFTYAFLIVMALIVLFPFYWMIISSLKTLAEYRQAVPTFWPKQIIWSNYSEAFTTANLGNLFMNTAYVGIVSTLLSLVITVLSAFAFARLEFKGKVKATFVRGTLVAENGKIVVDEPVGKFVKNSETIY